MTIGKEKIGFSVKDPTPKWATWAFRIEFLLNKAFLYGLSQHLFGDVNIEKAIGWAILIDGIVWGIGRSIGVKKEAFESDK